MKLLKDTPSILEPIISSSIIDANQPTILLAEDNPDMRTYLTSMLQSQYNILTAPHGKAALEVLNENATVINLVISDLMMPIMDGYGLIEAIKQDQQFQNLPTIMLTALSTFDNRIKALQIGINDYISKPFEMEELLLRIEYLLQFQQERNAISGDSSLDQQSTKKIKPLLSREDEKWLEELEKLCMNRLDDVNLTVAKLALELAVSHTKLWRKLQQLRGMSPAQYLQEIRFREARKYIEERRYSTVKQVAYAVGFKDERHFSRKFKKRFGKYPSTFLD